MLCFGRMSCLEVVEDCKVVNVGVVKCQVLTGPAVFVFAPVIQQSRTQRFYHMLFGLTCKVSAATIM